jgi:hypothetical protein
MRFMIPPRWAAFALVIPALAGCMVSFGEQPPAPLASASTAPAPAARLEYAPTPAEQMLGELLTRDPGQRRPSLTHSPVLARVARERAEDMARRGYFSHVNREGLGANTLVRRAGYRLPDHYDQRPSGNGIESLGTGYATPREVWRKWMGSAPHRAHLLGLSDAFARQSEYGIGHAFGRGGHYWVVLIAQPAPELEPSPAAR